MGAPSIFQWIVGFLVLVSSTMAVMSKNPVVSAIMLMSTLFLTGALYFGLGSNFIGAAQILIYAGAIAVLFVFIVMLLDLKPFYLDIPGRGITLGFSLLAVSLFFASMVHNIFPAIGVFGVDGSEQKAATFLSAKSISLNMLSNYMLPFQIAGLLILSAVMGAVIFGKALFSKGGEQ